MIKCIHRMKPFTREPGIQMLLPGTCELIRVFPTCIEQGSQSISLEVPGPVKRFMAMSDLERNEIVISGIGAHGPYKHILKGQELPERSRLHLGCHKAQDWLLMKRREDMREFLPFWLRFGQNLPDTIAGTEIGIKNRLEAERWLKEQFRVRFNGLGLPGAGMHYGLPCEGNDLEWLKGSSRWIEKLFVSEEGEAILLLPCLPPQLHAGRLLGASLSRVKVDLEWTKKQIRRATFYPKVDCEINIIVAPGFKTCRINGKHHCVNQKIQLHAGVKLNVDCFC